MRIFSPSSSFLSASAPVAASLLCVLSAVSVGCDDPNAAHTPAADDGTSNSTGNGVDESDVVPLPNDLPNDVPSTDENPAENPAENPHSNLNLNSDLGNQNDATALDSQASADDIAVQPLDNTTVPALPTLSIAPKIGDINFTSTWDETVNSALVEGESVRITYSLDRLTTCRGTHNGHPAWNLETFVRFLPSNAVASDTVRVFDAPFGVPNNNVSGKTVQFDIPLGTTSIEVWAKNSGINCEAYDSNFGVNYSFSVQKKPGFVGDASALITRASGNPCDGAQVSTTPFSYDTWARSRAVRTNLCLAVWQQGLTDWDNPNLWRDLDARIYYRFDANKPFQSAYINLVGKVSGNSNNAQYAYDLRSLDPFRPYQCPGSEIKIDTFDGGGGQMYQRATMQYFFVVNGLWVGPKGATPVADRSLVQSDNLFTGTFVDYPNPTGTCAWSGQ